MTALYKYIKNPTDVEYILRGELKFTPIPELNDPSELVPDVSREDFVASLEHMRKVGFSDEDMIYLAQQAAVLKRLAPNHMVIGMPSSKEQATATIRNIRIYENIDEMERRHCAATATIASKVGLLCLTRRYDSLPMWAHYAEQAKGLVVEFCDLDQIFRGDKTGVLNQLANVRYDRDEYGVTYIPKTHDAVFLSKFKDWSYEEEVRVIRPFDECREKMVNGKLLHVFQVPKKHIKRVILGWHIKPEEALKVIDLVRSENDDVKVVRAQIHRGRVRIE